MRHLTVDDGLSKSVGVSLLQDDKGFMWIGTYDGLNRYDGYDFKIFRPDPNATNTLSNNYINVLFEDRDNYLWVGTREGLNRYSPYTQTFQQIRISDSEKANSITGICQDDFGKIWVGTELGLFILNSVSDSSWLPEQISAYRNERITMLYKNADVIWIGTDLRTAFIHSETMQMEQVHFIGIENAPLVWQMIRDKKGTLWAGSDTGLWSVDEDARTCIRPSQPALNQKILQEAAIKCLVMDEQDGLWLGTWGEGVYRYDPLKSRLERIVNSQSPGLPNHIIALQKDRFGLIWIGSKSGVHLYDLYKKPFISFADSKKNGLSWSNAKTIVQDPMHDEILWIGTDQGLLRSDVENGEMRKIPIQSDNPYPEIHTLFMQPSGILWIGTEGNFFAYHTVKEQWQTYPQPQHPDSRVTSMNYYSILWDHTDNLWLGTYENGLIRFYPGTHQVKFYLHDPDDPKSLPDDHIWILFEDREHQLWVGTDHGAALYDPDTDSFTVYTENDSIPLANNKVRGFHQTHDGALWIGTDGGISRLDPETGGIDSWSEKDGLPNHVIHGILEENRPPGGMHAIWVSTNNGLLRYNPETDSWTAFYKEDGLHGSEFSRNSCVKLKDGRLVFGGKQGWTLFDPVRFVTNPHPPALVFTDFKIYHESVPVGQPVSGHVVLNQSIAHTYTIHLSHEHGIIGFEFAAIHFAQPEKNHVMYYLDGFDPTWIDSHGMHKVTYTNLSPGKYAFHFKAANSDGVWSPETTSVILVVHPQFWQRWSVRILGVLFVVIGVFGYYKYRTRQMHKRYELLEKLNIQLQNQIQERKKVEKTLRESKKALTRSLEEKEVLLKEIHHRVKNNLQVVKSLLYLQSTHVVHEKDREIFKESQDRVQAMALIHEKLYKSGNLAHIDFRDYIDSLVTDLYSIYKSDSTPIDMHLDVREVNLSIHYAVPCGLMINELVSNAMKHAFIDSAVKNPRIDISLSQDRGKVILIVKDNGIGLPADWNINQIDSLGLDLVKILVEKQLHGQLSISGKRGARFKIAFKTDE